MEKIKNYLGLARNAGYVIIGSDKLDGYTKKLYLILIDKTAGRSSLKIAKRFQDENIPVKSVENLGNLIELPTCKIIGIKNKGLSEEILKYLN